MNKNLEGYEWFKQGLKKEELLKAVKPAGKRQFILQNRSVKTHMNRFIILPSLYNRMIILWILSGVIKIQRMSKRALETEKIFFGSNTGVLL